MTDPAFAAGGFFDPADLLQVKYEMVRRSKWTACRCPRRPRVRVLAPVLYNAQAALAEDGLAALIPAKPGPKSGHKLTGPVVDHLEALLEPIPG